MSKMALVGREFRIAPLVLIATVLACENAGLASEPVFSAGRGGQQAFPPDPAYREIPRDDEVTEDFLDEDMARALAEHRGISLDGSTYSEAPLGPCDFLGKGVCCPPAWYIDQQVRVITRGRPRQRELSSEYLPDVSAQLGTPFAASRMSTKSITFEGTPGYYTTIGRHLARDTENRDHFLEFTYWGFHSWDETRMVTGKRIFPFGGVESGSLFSPFDRTADILGTNVIGGFNFADTHVFRSQSHMHNWELNARIRPRIRKDRLVLHPSGRWRREKRPGPYYSFLYGLRAIRFGDQSQFSSRSRIIENGDVFDTFGDYHVWAGNSMVGLQIGGDLIYRYNKWSWGFRGKVAAMVNSADQTSLVRSTGFGVVPNFQTSDSRRALAAVIEFGATGRYMITPHFWVTASYDLMWIAGLALAPNQMEFTTGEPSGRVDTGATVFYHGLTAGFEWTF